MRKRERERDKQMRIMSKSITYYRMTIVKPIIVSELKYVFTVVSI